MNNYIVGIDPGLTGSIVVLVNNEIFEVYDMPTRIKSRKRERSKTTGKMRDKIIQEIDPIAVYTILHPSHITSNAKIYIENVGPVYRQDENKQTSHQALHATCVQCGGMSSLRTVAEICVGVENVNLVAPISWKKYFNLLKKDKDEARILAKNTIPHADKFLSRKKDIGRADALLIAMYGLAEELSAEE